MAILKMFFNRMIGYDNSKPAAESCFPDFYPGKVIDMAISLSVQYVDTVRSLG